MSRGRVLVVDDQPQNRLVAAGHLEIAGYDVATAGTGEEALSRVVSLRPDLIVLDVLMPGIGGFEACRRIRAMPEVADTPILFLTALGDREATEPALAAGGDDLLGKPFQRAELILRVTSLIRQRRTANELREAARLLAAQNEQLKQLEETKRRMAQLIVHDLRGSLASILGNAELLRDARLGGELAEGVDDIMNGVTNIDHTIANLLELARAADVGVDLHAEPFDMPTLANDVIQTLRGLGRGSNVRLVPDVRVDRVVGDRELIRRMLQNLVHNAIKHAPAQTDVTIGAQSEGDAVVLRVCDRGPGIAPGDLERIFDRYMSHDRRRDRRSHGLGLEFCRIAAEAHGGRIWVEEHAPTGAMFCVRIPQPELRS